MALSAADKKAIAQAQAMIAQKQAQVAALEKQQADAAAKAAAAKETARRAQLEDMKLAREADLAAKAAARQAAKTTTTTTTTTDPSTLAIKGSNIFQMLGGILYFSGVPFTGKDGGKNYVNGVVTEDSSTGADGKSGTGSTTTPVPTGPTLAIDTFKNTLALFFGQAEMSKPWVDGLYKSISSFYKTGSTVEESFNLALQASRTNEAMKPFTDRFKGIYALQDAKAKGSAIEVPTIAEYFKTESTMGDILRSTGLGSIATETFLGDVIGKGVSATEFSNRITAVFDRIDQAPKEIKDTLTRFFPQVDRTELAKALLSGDKGAKELQSKIQGYEVLAAAEAQGIGAQRIVDGVAVGVVGGITEDIAANLAAGGSTYANTMGGFAQVAQARETEAKLAAISGKTSMGVTGLTNAVLGKKASELTALEKLTTEEENRFKAKAGIASLASSKRAQSF